MRRPQPLPARTRCRATASTTTAPRRRSVEAPLDRPLTRAARAGVGASAPDAHPRVVSSTSGEERRAVRPENRPRMVAPHPTRAVHPENRPREEPIHPWRAVRPENRSREVGTHPRRAVPSVVACPHQSWHVTWASEGRHPLAPDEVHRRDVVRVIARVAPRAVSLFCVVDDHIHVVPPARRDSAGTRARAAGPRSRPHGLARAELHRPPAFQARAHGAARDLERLLLRRSGGRARAPRAPAPPPGGASPLAPSRDPPRPTTSPGASARPASWPPRPSRPAPTRPFAGWAHRRSRRAARPSRWVARWGSAPPTSRGPSASPPRPRPPPDDGTARGSPRQVPTLAAFPYSFRL